MGYSISVHIKDKQIHKKMLDFMVNNFKMPSAIFKQDWDNITPVITELAYDHAKTAIGFDYHVPTEPEFHYVWQICCWMALKSNTNEIYYDGEKIQVFIKDSVKKVSVSPTDYPIEKPVTLVDENGFRPFKTKSSRIIDILTRRRQWETKIKQELQRLSEEWNKVI